MVIKFGCAIDNPKDASAVEKAGFDSIWVADHFAPFSHELGLLDPISAVSWSALPILPVIPKQYDQMRSWHVRVVSYP
jgi:hypothetical protein